MKEQSEEENTIEDRFPVHQPLTTQNPYYCPVCLCDFEIWTGENAKIIQDFIGDMGYIKGSYVEIGTNKGLRVAHVGDYIVRNYWNDFEIFKPEFFKQIFDIIET